MKGNKDNSLLSQSLFEKLFIEFLALEGASKKTQKNYLYDVKNFFQWVLANTGTHALSISTLTEISSTEIAQYNEYLHTVHKSTTVTRHISSVKSFYQALNHMRLVETNPVINFLEHKKNVFSTQKNSLGDWKLEQIEQGCSTQDTERDIQHIEEFLIWINTYKNI
jgi:site-specific recombinase XerD